jgi:transposase
MAQSKEERKVFLGVDTHLDTHVGVVIDGVGKVLGTLITPVGLHGYQQLLQWSRLFGECTRAGVEGTGTYGAGLSRFLREAGIEVLEVNRADRLKRGVS